MTTPGGSAVERPGPMPHGLRYVLRSRLLPGAFGPLIVPVIMLVVALLMPLRIVGSSAEDSLWRMWLFLLIASSVWTIIAGLWVWLRWIPFLGIDRDGLWVRPVLWSRRARFVARDRIQHVELTTVRSKSGEQVGVKIRLHTPDGPLPRGRRFVPCDKDTHDTLVTKLRNLEYRMDLIPRGDPRHVTIAVVIMFVALTVILLGTTYLT